MGAGDQTDQMKTIKVIKQLHDYKLTLFTTFALLGFKIAHPSSTALTGGFRIF